MSTDSPLFSVVGSVRHVRESYRRFVLSTYRLADPKLREQFEEQVNEADVLVKGPYVTLARDFESGKPLADLVAEDLAHASLAKLNWNFGEYPLYAHQEQSLRAAAAGRNIVVKTGTGSGKTESFLLPVLDGVARLREQGVKGLKAILLYPMNALANDQLTRLRELFRDSGTPFTFGLYTGDSDEAAKSLGDGMLTGFESINREDIRQNPPDILLTNFKQLEFLLIRKRDRNLFSPSLRFLVLDEIHTYRGALATEIACLIRRLKARSGLKAGDLRCLGTSATVSQDAGGDEALARFVSDLFGEPFAQSDIIGESVRPVIAPSAPRDPVWPEISEEDLASAVDEESILQLAGRLTGGSVTESGPIAERIRSAFAGNRLVDWLNDRASAPVALQDLAARLPESFAASEVLGLAARERLLEAYLLVGSVGADERTPVLRPKLHSFFHGLYDIGLCMNPECRLLVRDGSDNCPACHSAVRPAAICRTCGQDYVKVKFFENDPTLAVANDDFASDENTAFITPFICGEEDAEDEDEETGDDSSSKKKRPEKLRQEWVDHKQGRVYTKPPPDTTGMSCQRVMRGKGNTCPVCGGTYTRGDIITLLRTGAAATTSVLATHHLDRLPSERRKLLIFADNRQEAAHQAGYMTGRHREFALRHAIARVVKDAGSDGIALNMVSNRLLEVFQDMGIAQRRLNPDERKWWLKALEYGSAGEFCFSGYQRISLENLAIVEVRYDFLDDLASKPRFVDSCAAAGISVHDGVVLARAILDQMRRRRSVAMPFFQQYIDPTNAKWAELTQPPYSVNFPEREVRPVYFVMERSEAAKGNPGGTTFFPFLHDTERGAKGVIPKIVQDRAGLRTKAGDWTMILVRMLADAEILVPHVPSAAKARSAVAGMPAYQINPRFIRLVSAETGWRCQRCQTWRAYQGLSCYGSSRCKGGCEDQKPATLLADNYYERLYLDAAPRRLRAKEHTAQISQEDRAKLETDFKGKGLEALVCSPTLELGVNIGALDTVLLRNAPPSPANYVQRAGRAGRSHRIGFVSTFCGVGPHDRHCFEDPPWLVRGEFKPPTVKLDNDRIVGRHTRSFLLEEITNELPVMLHELIEDVQNPADWKRDGIAQVASEVASREAELTAKAAEVFGANFAPRGVVAEFPYLLNGQMESWFQTIQRLFKEWEEWKKILSDRFSSRKAAAKGRAYRELTQDPQRAHVLSYLADNGVLPSYQFPTDTFSLDPGVPDTPTLRRPAWIALFEFAPGNMVYANGHKLKSIRGFFEGRRKGAGSSDGAGGGRVQRYYFCEHCGVALNEPRNACPQCGNSLTVSHDVAVLENFEAEENTQITSGEEARERLTYDRGEHIVFDPAAQATIYPWEFATLELRPAAQLLITNRGKKRFGSDRPGAGFQLCPACGRHKPDAPAHPTKAWTAREAKWNEDHARFCREHPASFFLGYEFKADALFLPVAPIWLHGLEDKDRQSLLKTLGTALVAGATEVLELEPDEIAHFSQGSDAHGWNVVFYETVPGGAGYLDRLARQLPAWCQTTRNRLFNHECSGACYRCLKSYRNQYLHALLDKNCVAEMLVQLAASETTGAVQTGAAGRATKSTRAWFSAEAQQQQKPESPIEQALLQAIRKCGKLPEPMPQREFRNERGDLVTVADFAYEDHKVAIFCDGFAFHGNIETLESDAGKRNFLQAQGWRVLVFWGRTILRRPADCVDDIARALKRSCG